MHFIRSENNQKDADFKCNTMGRECQVTDSGHGAKVSMWFSGSKLVQLETKVRMSLSADSQSPETAMPWMSR